MVKQERESPPATTSIVAATVDPDKQEARSRQLGPPIDIVYQLKLTWPAKYEARIPVALKVSRDYAEYSSSYKLEGNTLSAERKFHLNRHELPPDRTQDYIAFAASHTPMADKHSLETELLVVRRFHQQQS